MGDISISTGAAILAGGKSSRMGANKALLRPGPSGATLIESVVAILRLAGLEPNLLVTNTPEEYAFLGLPTVTDVVEGAGPLGGILTALLACDKPRVFVVACDMPALSPALIAHMAALPDTHDAIVPRWVDGEGVERIETLHAAYSRRCIEPLRRSIAAGKLKAHSFLEEIPTRYLDAEELRGFDPELRSFSNVNTPEEWAQLVAAGRESDPGPPGRIGT